MVIFGGQLGYSWIFESGFTLGVAGGAQYGVHASGALLSAGDEQVGFFPRLGLHLGYSF